jgi:hypothetical protein
VLKVMAFASGDQHGISGIRAGGIAVASTEIEDEIVFHASDPSLDGAKGHATLSANADFKALFDHGWGVLNADYHAQVLVFNGVNGTYSDRRYNEKWVEDRYSQTPTETESATRNQVAVPFDNLILLDLDFTFGRPLSLQISLGGSAQVNPSNDFSDFLSTELRADRSLYWGGISTVTSNGAPVDFKVTSASGIDWSKSYIPNTADVPEPASLALLCAGLLGMTGLRHNKTNRHK